MQFPWNVSSLSFQIYVLLPMMIIVIDNNYVPRHQLCVLIGKYYELNYFI
jgi:hypothetical protein